MLILENGKCERHEEKSGMGISKKKRSLFKQSLGIAENKTNSSMLPLKP